MTFCFFGMTALCASHPSDVALRSSSVNWSGRGRLCGSMAQGPSIRDGITSRIRAKSEQQRFDMIQTVVFVCGNSSLVEVLV